MTNKEIAKTEENAMMPAWMQNYDSNAGNENVNNDDLMIPRIEVIQALSPVRKKKDPAYIEGAEEGMLYNTVTQELYGDSIKVVPVYFRKEFLIFKDRTKGGGFEGAFETEREAKSVVETMDTPQDYEVIESASQFVLVIKEGGQIEESVIAFTKTKLKVSRRWNSAIRMAGGPRFACMWDVKTVEESNDKGSWWTLKVSKDTFVDEKLAARAHKFYETLSSTAVQVSYEDVAKNGEAEGEY
jgi:hypothetical protein